VRAIAKELAKKYPFTEYVERTANWEISNVRFCMSFRIIPP
jgi:hypothetical protein